MCFSNSDYTGDPDSCQIVSGYMLFVQSVSIAWQSKAQKSVTLSSSGAEWTALLDAVNEIMFIINLLESMKIKVKLPVIIRVNNTGEIFMGSNVTTTSRTKHVDIRTKYVREYIEASVLKIIFVQSKDNTSDIVTKNVQGDLQDKHSKELVCEKL